jgi:hypothetical protein
LNHNGENEKAAALAGFVLSQPVAERQTRKLLSTFDENVSGGIADIQSALQLAFGE